MPSQKRSRVVIDTNLWISFLIGKELHYLKDLILMERIKLITTNQLLDELRVVTSKEKLKKYFNQDKVTDSIALLEIVGKTSRLKKLNKFAVTQKTISY